MELNKWIGSSKVRAFPWKDGKYIYVNVQYFKPGQSICKPPAWEQTAYIENNQRGRELVYESTATLVDAFHYGKIKHGYAVRVE